jgi:hypothetical protein
VRRTARAEFFDARIDPSRRPVLARHAGAVGMPIPDRQRSSSGADQQRDDRPHVPPEALEHSMEPGPKPSYYAMSLSAGSGARTPTQTRPDTPETR